MLDGSCYLDPVVTLRHSLLALGGVVVTVATIYLAVEVRATPAAAKVTARASATAPDDPGEPEARRDTSPTRAITLPSGSALARSGTSDAGSTSTTSPSASATPPSIAIEPTDEKQLKQLVTDAYGAYDRQEFEDAKALAARVVAADPKNVRALRILVSTSCIESNVADAQKYFDMLPDGKDRADMRTRCGRDYGITFK